MLKLLENAEEFGVEEAMQQALSIVNQADTKPIAQDLRKTIDKYCDLLFESCGLQTSVKKYQASNSQRGCILDFVDYPLNNRWWLEDQFKLIKGMEREDEKLEKIKTNIDLNVINITDKGEKEGDVAVATIAGYASALLIYFFIFLSF